MQVLSILINKQVEFYYALLYLFYDFSIKFTYSQQE